MSLRPHRSSARRHALAGGIVGSALLAIAAMGASEAARRPSPTPAALEAFRTLAASKMGMDHAGNLWAWNRRNGVVQILTPAGERLPMPAAQGAGAVDADAAWGVVAVFDEIRWLRLDRPMVTVPLGGQAADVCWIDAQTVAVTPQTNAHRVEVWDLRTRTLVRALGAEEPTPVGPGAFRLRNVLLRFDAARHLLYSLESFTGDLKVFRPTGEVVWSSTLPTQIDAELDAAIAANDHAAKAAGRRVPLTFSRLAPALDRDGNLWVIEDSERATKSMNLLRISPAGATTLHLADQACPTQTFTFWGDVMLFYTDPTHAGGMCNTVRRPS